MQEKTSLDRIALAVQDALDSVDAATTRVMLQLMQTGYAIGLADAQKAS